MAAVREVLKTVTRQLMFEMRKPAKWEKSCLMENEDRKDVVNILWPFFHKCSECRKETQGKRYWGVTRPLLVAQTYTGAKKKRFKYERELNPDTYIHSRRRK